MKCQFCKIKKGTESINEVGNGEEALVCKDCDDKLVWEPMEKGLCVCGNKLADEMDICEECR